MNMDFLIFISIYIISGVGWWLYIHIAYSKGGIYEHQDGPDAAAVAIMVVPIINTLVTVFGWIFQFPIRIDKSKFFKIK